MIQSKLIRNEDCVDKRREKGAKKRGKNRYPKEVIARRKGH